MIPVRPAHRNWNRNAQQNSIGVWNRIFPPYMVASQLKIFIPVGTATSMVEAAKNELSGLPMPTANMWWAQVPMATRPMADRGRHQRRVAEDAPCARTPG